MPTSSKARTDDLHVAEMVPLVPPCELRREMALSDAAAGRVVSARETIVNILQGQDKRLLALVGPCSIHDTDAALDYARKLKTLADEVSEKIYVVMRVYFEKPRTTVGWKGLINDPHLDGTFDMATGLQRARKLLLDLVELGLPTGTEMLDPITPQYIADLVAWASIGARTTESQTHRQMASGLSMPVGFKNATSGDLGAAVNAMKSARSPHSFLGLDDHGKAAIVRTTGNPWGHLILRGGKDAPNYDPQEVAAGSAALQGAGLPTALMVDCSHANSGKQHQRQELVWNSIIDQRAAGNGDLVGAMLESNINEGAQKLTDDLARLKYGISVTDQCMGWDKTEQLLREAAARL